MSDPTADTGSTEPPILVTDGRGICRVTLNRPAVRNALDSHSYQLLGDALEQAGSDERIACVLVHGAGNTFTAGVDLRDDGSPAESRWDAYESFIHRLESFPKPLIAAVQGVAVGIGATMLGHFDLVFAARSARLRLPFVPFGLAPEAGSTVTLPALMGAPMTAHALFTGSWISAEEAAAAGLVWRIADDDQVLEMAESECAEIATMPVPSLVATKQLLLASRLDAARAARSREEIAFRRLADGPAHAEALVALGLAH